MPKVQARATAPSEYQTERDKKAAAALTRMHSQSEESEAAMLAKQAKLAYADLHIFPVDHNDIRLIPIEKAKEMNVAVFQKKGPSVRIALTDPFRKDTVEFLQTLADDHRWKMSLYVVSTSSLQKAWAAYEKTLLLNTLDSMRLALSGADLEKFEKDFGDLLALKHHVTEIPTTAVMQTILAGAIKLEASDIHIEPQEKDIRLRYRIDGILQDVGSLPKSVYTFIVSRVKMLGGMKLNVRERAQDGRFSVALDEGLSIDIRVNLIPGHYGENINMRLLDQSTALLKVESLGLAGLAAEQVQKNITKPTGMILNTGPTGSGKTTTLYALLNNINEPGVKIITIEDPVEYKIPGLVQTQVSKNKDYTFAAGLRSIVRQDPDVILVGEIRDEETADIAINAALTGHLVLSTLHANNAAGAIPRLMEMGIKPAVVAPAVNIFIAQRLVRKLCQCKESYEPAPETTESLKEILSLISPKAQVALPKNIPLLYRAKGCVQCHGTGYRGRIGIFEILAMDQTIEKLALEVAPESEIMQAALENGMVTMAQDGILKAVAGTTSLEEVWRVTGETEFLQDLYNKLMEQTLARSFRVNAAVMAAVREVSNSFETLNTHIREVNQADTLRAIFAAGILLHANDIHLEPTEESILVRLRIDGILQTVATLPITEYQTLLADIKLLGGFKTEVRAGVKDSRFSIILEEPATAEGEMKIDVRISIILGGLGETVVMRLLNQGAVALDMEILGFREQNLKKMLSGVKRSTGLILNTGPTGSGKTTTLYSLLKLINKPEVKIITVEDPIEYQMPGVLQTQVNEEGGYSFGTALRALMRQNPDILMIGEIRDEETAKIAVQASLTGHLVLATLHTNNAAGSIPRLVNMGVSTDDLINAGGLFMAQRLVRRLCSACQEKIPLSGENKERVEHILKSIGPKTGVTPTQTEFSFGPKGCDKCNHTGYSGRLTLSEVLPLDKDIQLLISQNALAVQIQEKAVENGMITLSQDGVLRALSGETSLEEIWRVTEE